MISNPELPEIMGSSLGNIEQRLSLLTPLTKLKGRINLLLPQATGNSKQDMKEQEEPLFLYNDKGKSNVEKFTYF